MTCILVADAVGYSKLMSQDEANTHRVLAAHRAVIDGVIAFHEGRIVSTAGDSVLAEFGSAVEAVRCAVEIQDALSTRNEALPENRRLLFRIGVNLGDVVVKGTDLLGDSVNIAARLESVAEPGGIVVSSSVYDQITGKLATRDKADAEVAAARTPTEAEAAKTSAASQPAPRFDPSTYDGAWTGNLACDGFEELPAGSQTIPVTAAGGIFVVEWGGRGNSGGGHAEGRPSGDGSLTLRGTSVARSKRAFGKTIGVRFDGNATRQRFDLRGHIGQRNCTLSLTRAG